MKGNRGAISKWIWGGVILAIIGGFTACGSGTRDRIKGTTSQEYKNNEGMKNQDIVFQTNEETDGLRYSIRMNKMIDTYIIADIIYRSKDDESLPVHYTTFRNKAEEFFKPYKSHEFIKSFSKYLKGDKLNTDAIGILLSRTSTPQLKEIAPVYNRCRGGLFKEQKEIDNLINGLSDFYKDTNAEKFFSENKKALDIAKNEIKENIRKYKIIELMKEGEEYLKGIKGNHKEKPTYYENIISVFGDDVSSSSIIEGDNEKGFVSFHGESGFQYHYTEKAAEINENLGKWKFIEIRKSVSRETIRLLIDEKIKELTEGSFTKFEINNLRITENREYRNSTLDVQLREYIARAVQGKLYKRIFGENEGARIIDYERDLCRFDKLDGVYRELDSYERNRDLYPTMDEFIPRIVEFLTKTPRDEMKKNKSDVHKDLSLEEAKNIIWKTEFTIGPHGEERGEYNTKPLGRIESIDRSYYFYFNTGWNGYKTFKEFQEAFKDYCTPKAMEYLVRKEGHKVFNGKIGSTYTNEMWNLIDKEKSKVRFKINEERYKEVEVEMFSEGDKTELNKDNLWKNSALYTFKYIDGKWKIAYVDGYSRAIYGFDRELLTYSRDFNEITASSELKSEYNQYDPYCIADDKRNSAWVEGVDGDGIGEWICFKSKKALEVAGIDIQNGYQKSLETYGNNNRVKKIRVQFSDGTEETFHVEEKEIKENYYWPLCIETQYIDFGRRVKTDMIKVTILEVYKGEKYSDTCVSEIRVVEAQEN